jgi:hypothetical protein
MRNELARTALFAAAGVALVAAAAWIEPESARPDIFSDQGEALFPGFRDVLAVKAIEVIDYNEAEATARPLKVEFRKNRFVLASHNDYPAEAKERMAQTAAALLDLKRDLSVSDRFEDHAQYGVIDPLDAQNPSLAGRGKHVTLRDAQGAVLANLVLGYAVKERAGYRYARLPGQKRVYAIKTDADPSARFEDWVESDLLRVSANGVARMVLNSYSIDETFGRLMNMQRTVMVKDKENWDARARSIASALGSLRVVGARPKPQSLAEQLRTRQLTLTLDNVMSLRQRGFFITPDGRLLANAGELIVETERGLAYTLRFGEVVSGASESPQGAAAGTEQAGARPARQSENRYLFVTVAAKAPEREAAARALDSKFADWYYAISGADFDKLRPASLAAKGGTPLPAPQQRFPGMPAGPPPPPVQPQ